MPRTEVRMFRAADGTAPLQAWLRKLKTRERKAYAKCLARITELGDFGHQMRDPHARFLERGIYELRTKKGRVHYRMLYSFHGSHIAILTSGFTKECEVPKDEIDLAVECMTLVKLNPGKYTVEFEE